MRPRHIALLVLICAIWGFNFVVSKVAVEHFPPMFFTSLRFALLCLLLLPWLKWHPGQMHLVFGISVFMGTLHFALMFTAIRFAHDVSVIAVVAQLGVPISSLLAWVFLGETVRWRRASGILLAFIGTMVMSFDPKVLVYAFAIMIGLLSTVSMSVGQILIRRIREVDAFSMQAWIGVASAPGLFLLSLVFETGQMTSLATADWLHWGMVAYSAIGVSLIGHGGAYYLLRNYPVAVVNPGFTLGPVLGILFAVALLGEQLGMKVIIGAVLTLVGVFIVNLREGRLADTHPEDAKAVALKAKVGSD